MLPTNALRVLAYLALQRLSLPVNGRVQIDEWLRNLCERPVKIWRIGMPLQLFNSIQEKTRVVNLNDLRHSDGRRFTVRNHSKANSNLLHCMVKLPLRNVGPAVHCQAT